MEITRQRSESQRLVRESQNSLILKSKRNRVLQAIEWIINLILWSYMMLAIVLFISGIFGYNNRYLGVLRSCIHVNNEEIRRFEVKMFIYFMLLFLILWVWKFYNRKRYGKLNRRHDCGVTSEEEMLSLGLICREDVKILHSEQVIVFENNPVKAL